MGLLSSLGKIGGAVGKFAPFVGPAITAFQIGKSLTGGKKKKKGVGDGATDTDSLLGKQGEVADTSLDFAKNMFGGAKRDIGSASKYLQPLVSGSNEELSEALAPDIGAIQEGSDQAIEESARFGPRSGGQAFSTTLIRNQRNRQIAEMISKRRSEAAGQIGQLGLGQAQAAVGSARTAGAD